MKAKFWTTISLAVVAITMNAYSQRTVFFGNRVPWTTPPTDNTSRPIYLYYESVKLMNDVDHVYKAQLYFAPGADVWDNYLVPVDSAPRNFFSTEALAGFFSTASTPLVYLGGVSIVNPGMTATLQVRVWDSRNNTLNTYEEAASALVPHGRSIAFNLAPTDMYMEGFQSFVLIPEPSSLALVVLGGGMAWLWRRLGRQAK